MIWTASDYALIITTTTTAISVFAGFILPSLKERSQRKFEEKKRLYETFRGSLLFCATHLTDVVLFNRQEMLRLAYLKANRSAGEKDKSLGEIDTNFRRHLATVKILAAEGFVAQMA